jgi:putative phosphoesterase
MRVAVIADVHSNSWALRAVMRDMPRTDLLVCAGDLVGWGADPLDVIRWAKRRRLVLVRGDHDHSVATGSTAALHGAAAEVAEWTGRKLGARELEFLRSLPEVAEFKAGGYRIVVVHGSPRRPLTGRLRPHGVAELAGEIQDVDADIVIAGHLHVPFQRRVLGKVVLNPGSVGMPKDRDPRASYALVKLGGEITVEHRRVAYDVERAKRAVLKAGLPEEIVIRLSFGW